MNDMLGNRIRFACQVAILLLLTACSSSAPLTRQYLDPLTGATITRASEPLVLFRDLSAKAANAREYVYLGPVEVNTMGVRKYYLWLSVWGTSDTRSDALDDFASVVIFADGEPLSLSASGWTLSTIGASEPVYIPPVAGATDAWYQVTVDQIRLIAESRDIELRAGTVVPRHYMPWESTDAASASLVAFLRQVY